MSKTFTSKPTTAKNTNPNTNSQTGISNRGRGTTVTGSMASGMGRGLPATRGTRGALVSTGAARRGQMSTGGTGSCTEADVNTSQPQAQQLDQSQRMSYQGGFTMITPNEKRRREIQAQADKETQNYLQHKEEKKVGHMNYIGTAGGGEITELQARNRLIQQNRNPNMRLREKQEEYRSQQKRKEEEEINQKRAKQRELADKNKLMQQKKEMDQSRRWDEDRKRVMNKFLDQQKSNQNKTQGNLPRSRLPEQPISSVQSSTSSTNDYIRPNDTQSAPSYTPNVSSVSDDKSPRNRQGSPSYNPNIPSMHDDESPRDIHGAIAGMHLSDSVQEDINELHEIFPQCDRDFLADILNQMGSVAAAIEMLN